MYVILFDKDFFKVENKTLGWNPSLIHCSLLSQVHGEFGACSSFTILDAVTMKPLCFHLCLPVYGVNFMRILNFFYYPAVLTFKNFTVEHFTVVQSALLINLPTTQVFLLSNHRHLYVRIPFVLSEHTCRDVWTRPMFTLYV